MKIAVVGISGKMGNILQSEIKQDDRFTISGGVHSSHEFEHFFKLFKQSDIIIDFSHPASLPYTLNAACKLNKPIVIGTTGYTQKELDELILTSSRVPIFYTANFSLGIFLLSKMIGQINDELNFFESIDLIEWHQKEKKDLPSGTALSLTNEIKKRTNKKIQMHSIRSGNIFREHSIHFTSENERLTLKHESYDRSVYAKGSLHAALFLRNMQNGLYSMEDLLTEKSCAK